MPHSTDERYAVPLSSASSKHFMESLHLRSSKYFKLLKKRPLSLSALESYWTALWVIAEAHAESWRSLGGGGLYRPPSSSSIAGDPSASNNRLKVTVVPKLFALNFGDHDPSDTKSIVHRKVAPGGNNNIHSRPSSRCSSTGYDLDNGIRLSTPAGVGARLAPVTGPRLTDSVPPSLRFGSTGGVLPNLFLEVSNEFQRSRGIRQAASSIFHTDGFPERVVEISSREILQTARVLFNNINNNSVTSSASHADGSPSVVASLEDISSEDVAALGRMVGDAICDASQTCKEVRLACGKCGELRITSTGGATSISFTPWNNAAGSGRQHNGGFDNVHRGGEEGKMVSGGEAHFSHNKRNKFRATTTTPAGGGALESLVECKAIDAASSSTRPPRSSSSSCVSHPTTAPAAHQQHQQQTSLLPAVGSGAGGGREGSINGSTAAEVMPIAPELRKYNVHSSSAASDLSTQRLPSRQSNQNANHHHHHHHSHGSLPPRPSSQCSSLGPSASEVGGMFPANSAAKIRLSSDHLSTANHLHTAAPSATVLDRSKHRREVLDHELAEIQRALETRLGMTSSMSAGGGAQSPGRDSSSPASFNASHSSKRSATALAYYSAVPDENRHPAQDRREFTMHLAMKRHRDVIKQRELEEARIDAARGAKEAQAILARVDTEMLRRANAETLTQDLNAQKHFHSLRRDGRGRMTGDVETSIMRPTPSPAASSPQANSRRGSHGDGIPSTSVAALGSDPASVVDEKRAERAKRRAYGADLDSINAALNVEKLQRQQTALLLDQKLLAENAAELQYDKDQKVMKKASFRHHYVEAWNMQRKIASSPAAKMIVDDDDDDADDQRSNMAPSRT